MVGGLTTKLIFALAMTLLVTPALAFASSGDTAARAKVQAAAIDATQLDNLNTRVVTGAFLTARIIGYDRGEIDQLKVDMAALKQENAQLRAHLQSGPVAAPELETRVARLETALDSLQATLKLVVSMLVTLLAKL